MNGLSMNGLRSSMNKRSLWIGAGVAMLLLGGLLWGSILEHPLFVNAQTSNEEVFGEKYYTSIQIQEGDSLWSIAQEYSDQDDTDLNTYIHEIKNLNRLKSDKIHAGEYLLVPYYRQ